MPFGPMLTHRTRWKKTGRIRLRPGKERAGLFATRPVLVVQFEETAFEWADRAPPPPEAPQDWKPSSARPVNRWRDARLDEILPVDAIAPAARVETSEWWVEG